MLYRLLLNILYSSIEHLEGAIQICMLVFVQFSFLQKKSIKKLIMNASNEHFKNYTYLTSNIPTLINQ